MKTKFWKAIWHIMVHGSITYLQISTICQIKYCQRLFHGATKAQSIHIEYIHQILEHQIFKELRMKGGDIFPYLSVYWNNIWIQDLFDPLWLIGFSSPPPLFIPISSPIVYPLYFISNQDYSTSLMINPVSPLLIIGI